MATNDVTGDSLVSKPADDKYRDGWERIYGNARPVVASKEEMNGFENISDLHHYYELVRD
jgi:hypothetical protein